MRTKTTNIHTHLFVPILVALILLLLRESIIIITKVCFPEPPLTVWWNLEMYKWTTIGAVAYCLIKGLMGKNLKWMETFTHELTHTVVSIMLFRKVHSFRANENCGEVSTSGGKATRVFVSLAPYCLPIYTYFFLFFRMLIVTEGRWIYDIIIGMTIAFHAFCFKSQTSQQQPDIHQFPLTFSYLYITAALLFNINTILVSYWSSKNIFTALWFTVTSIWEGITSFIQIIP